MLLRHPAINNPPYNNTAFWEGSRRTHGAGGSGRGRGWGGGGLRLPHMSEARSALSYGGIKRFCSTYICPFSLSGSSVDPSLDILLQP